MSKKTSPAQAELVDEIEYPFAQIPTAFLEAAKGKAMSNHARWLFVLLRGYLNRASKVAFPSYDRIREDTSWAYDTISKALKELEDTGWLSRQKRFGDSTIYRLHFPKSSPERSTVAKSIRIKSSIPPNLGQIESNHRKVINHVLGDVDTPHTPSQSFEGKEPLSLLAKLKIVPAPDKPVQIERTACRCDLNGSCVNHPYTMEGCSEPGRLYRLQAEKDWQAKQAALTVHANGGIATPPEVAAAPPSAQAAVIAPAPNAQLRVLSPASDLVGIAASVEVVDQPCAPVSVEKRKTSRKAKTVTMDSPEEIQRKADHVTLMDTLHTRTGQPILNGGAQAGAIKRILGAYTVEQAIEVLDYQLAGNWRGPVSWLSVQTQIADYFRRKEQPQTKLGGFNTNGKSKFDFFDICNSQPFASY